MKTLPHKLLSLVLGLVVLGSSFLASPSSASAQITIDPTDNLCDIIDILGIIPSWFGIGPPWYNDNICGFSSKVFGDPQDELFGERYTYAQVGWIINSIILHSPAGFIFKDNFINISIRLFSQNPSSRDFSQLGLPGALMGNIVYMFDHPVASGFQATKQTLAKFNLVQPAYAQGAGYNSLTAVQWLWTASRNFAYLVTVIILLFSSFAVLFRLKVGPQTVVSLQLLIPRLIIALVTITFSYAIAGFVIDLVYVVITLVLSGLSLGSGFSFILIRDFITNPGFSNFAILYLITLVILTLYNLATLNIGVALGFVIIFFIALFLLFKVWWMLLKTYVTLMLLIITGPWQIMLGFLTNYPGFGGWFRNLIANASVFVVVPLMFLFNLIFWAIPEGPNGIVRDLLQTVASLTNVPVVSDLVNYVAGQGGNLPQLPLMGSQDSNLVFLGIGFVILSLIPKTAEIIRDALKIPAFKYGSAVGEALGPVSSVGRFGAQYTSNWATGRVSPETGGWAEASAADKLMYAAAQVAKTTGKVK